MAKVQLFANWTWKIGLPEPFDKSTSVSTDHYSSYCTVATKKSTLHSSLLSAVLAYMEMDTSLTPGSTSESAIGTQGDKVVAEYQSRTGEIHVVVFNKKNGKFNVGRFDSVGASPKVYSLKDGGNLGTALFFALMPEALKDDEFRENYDILGTCKNDGYTDMEKAETAAYILCDNLYRRIESADMCVCFEDFYDANISHNDLVELTLNHLRHASLMPEFFISLAENAPAICMGAEKNIEECEQNCGKYHRCNNIADANDRSRQWETLASLLSMHQGGICTCGKDENGETCPAAKYLAGAWDISEFFHSEDRKEAA